MNINITSIYKSIELYDYLLYTTVSIFLVLILNIQFFLEFSWISPYNKITILLVRDCSSVQ